MITDKQRKKVYVKALEYILKNPDTCNGPGLKSLWDNYPGLCPLIGRGILKLPKDKYYQSKKESYTLPLMKYSRLNANEISAHDYWFTSREERMEILRKEIELLSKPWIVRMIKKIFSKS